LVKEYRMDIGEEEAFVFSVYCSGVWPKSAVELSPKFQPTKVLYETPEYCFKDYIGLITWCENTDWS
jgi:hypothetical protein